ncbi:MAG: SNF2 helicase associated domain-containing protein [Clostridia bacterium]|nr:SNF2 helicase associated domain-containing protein [Clostridia bacterium]MDD4048393.1 SNF2 helicase associated domain-containing protein [Clostridia bacterium]
MFKVNLNTKKIANGCYRTSAFQRGKVYYQNGSVRYLEYYNEHSSFIGVVRGHEDYQVIVHINEMGDVEGVRCTCPDYNDHPGYFCKHLVAAMFGILKKVNPELQHKQSQESVEKVFDAFEVGHIAKEQQELKLESTLFYQSERNFRGSNEVFYSLEFKVGLERLYVMKNVKQLLEARNDEEKMVFGKKFTYDPFRHKFTEKSNQILDILWELYELEKFSKNDYYSSGNAMFFFGKTVKIPEILAKRYLKIQKDSNFGANIEGQYYPDVSIVEEDLPLSFKLKKKGDSLIVQENIMSGLVALTRCGSYFFMDGKIYNISADQKKNFCPYYFSLQGSYEKTLRLQQENKERFISEILPKLQKVGNVDVDKNLAKEIDRIPLKASLYLDMENHVLWAELKFIYGEREINPFENSALPKSSRILLRDIEKEHAIMDILEETEFKVNGKKIFLEEENKIFEFVYMTIQKLQKDVEIYYSENMNQTSLLRNPSFRGRISLDKGTSMLDFFFDVEGIDRAELYEVFEACREKKKYYRLKDGSFLPLESKELQDMNTLVSGLNLKKKDFQKEVLQIPQYRAMYFDEYFQEKQLSFLQRSKAFKELARNIREPEEMEFTIPESLEGVLRDYQKDGFRWLMTLSYYGFGGILADDMGLGKTLQAIAYILARIKVQKDPVLVVAPTSVLYNWQAEVERFAPSIRTRVISGTKAERKELLVDLSQIDLVITSFPLLRRDIEEYTHNFNCCILDEAQNIKNAQSQTAKATKMIKAGSYLALTGTPIENSLLELWSIFDYIMQGYLPPYQTFVKKYLIPIEKDKEQKSTQELARLVRPFILRRIKEDVLKELPSKIENKMVSELEVEQKKIYMAYREKISKEIAGEIKENGFEKSRIKILAGLTRLRQICCHPSTFLENYKGESGKLTQLREVLQEIVSSGHRVLLFSQFTKMLAIIQRMLDEEKYKYFYLDGSVKAEERLKRVDAFNEGQGDIFLISLKAGGTGLNLIGADVVIHFDPWWNPAVEEQASDRAHRIGQKKVVQVMKFIARGTIEERIYELQLKKKELIDRVIQPGDNPLAALGKEDLCELLDIS